MVVHLTQYMHSSSLQDIQPALIIYETKLEQQNTISHISIPNSFKNVTYNNYWNRSTSSNNETMHNTRGCDSRGREDRNSSLYCQLYQ